MPDAVLRAVVPRHLGDSTRAVLSGVQMASGGGRTGFKLARWARLRHHRHCHPQDPEKMLLENLILFDDSILPLRVTGGKRYNGYPVPAGSWKVKPQHGNGRTDQITNSVALQ